MMFLLGVLVGMFVATIMIVGGFIVITRKRRALLNKATNLWTRATELVETANIWAAIGSEEDAQEEIRKVLVAYRNLYAFLSQVIPFQDSDLEKLHSYIRFLITKLPRRDRGPVYDFDDEIALKYYRLQKISEGSVDLRTGKGGEVPGPLSVGTGVSHSEEIELSKLIDILNDRFSTDFKPGDQLFFDSIREDAVADTALRQAAVANTLENFSYVFLKALEGLFIDRMDQNEEITAKFMNEKEFQEIIGRHLMKQVYEQIRAEEATQTS